MIAVPALSVSALAVFFAAVAYGTLAGLLLPRAAYRLCVPAEETWRSDCPRGHRLTGAAGGWLGAARCGASPACGVLPAPGARRCAVLTALVCAVLAAGTGARPELAVWLALAPVGVLAALVDVRVQRLPDVLTATMAAVAVAGLGLVALGGGGRYPGALLAALALLAFYAVLFLVNPAGMGLGDVKLAPALGAALGWYGAWPVFAATMLAFTAGALYGLVLKARRPRADGAGTAAMIPFGPFMLAAAWLTVAVTAAGR
ncbi:prepilin peptidase [Streptomyces polyrhachis]|uniref:Prepilin peptidase n=1 Tax=Streptomyces polyrhachis TaxID=1282885 RepID=A0ABW2GCE9_9ACTN